MKHGESLTHTHTHTHTHTVSLAKISHTQSAWPRSHTYTQSAWPRPHTHRHTHTHTHTVSLAKITHIHTHSQLGQDHTHTNTQSAWPRWKQLQSGQGQDTAKAVDQHVLLWKRQNLCTYKASSSHSSGPPASGLSPIPAFPSNRALSCSLDMMPSDAYTPGP